MEYMVMDGCLIQKSWSKNISSMFLSDLVVDIRRHEQDTEKSIEELGLTIVSANGRVGARWFNLDGLEKFIKSRAFYECWRNGERLALGIEVYRLYADKPIITARPQGYRKYCNRNYLTPPPLGRPYGRLFQ